MSSMFTSAVDALESRTKITGVARWGGSKVFPEHWSFLLGEVAMFSFVILVLTGIFLTLFYEPSTKMVTYLGSNIVYHGREVPAAFESVLRMSHDIPGAIFVRRIHRSASHLFLMSTMLHMMRVMLTGAFRKPRELNVAVGMILMVLGILGGAFGYSLPYDSLAGMGLRVMHAITMQTPFIGDWMAFILFGGEFPNPQVIPRIYGMHIFIFPMLIASLLGVHMYIMVQTKHTAFPTKEADGHDFVVGKPAWPGQLTETGTLLLWVFGLLALFQVIFPWADVTVMGPYMPAEGPNNAQPDWFMFFLEGAIRLFPPFEINILGTTITGVFLGAMLLPGILVGSIIAWPFIEAKIYGLKGEWHVLTNPLDVPARAAFIWFWFAVVNVASLGAANDILSIQTGITIERITDILRYAIIIVPIGGSILIYWLCTKRLEKRGRSVAQTEEEALSRFEEIGYEIKE